MLGSFDQAVSESARVLAVRGRVVPSTTDLVELVAHFADGRVVRGETALAADGAQCERVELDPPDPVAHPRALQAIERAELVVMGPGSLYTSTIPPLLVPGYPGGGAGRPGAEDLRLQPASAAGRDRGLPRLRPRGADHRTLRRGTRRRRAGQPKPRGAGHAGAGRSRRSAAAGRARLRRPPGRRVAARPGQAGAHAGAAVALGSAGAEAQ